ncbi:hypothetical protein QQ054_36480 [Oscillatoria amoena NRMC-F 0135]|nr:hypothetical protein [Oscillatoria amoena NRMC-F 0135]
MVQDANLRAWTEADGLPVCEALFTNGFKGFFGLDWTGLNVPECGKMVGGTRIELYPYSIVLS